VVIARSCVQDMMLPRQPHASARSASRQDPNLSTDEKGARPRGIEAPRRRSQEGDDASCRHRRDGWHSWPIQMHLICLHRNRKVNQ
jgi:hypothetical protein